MSTTKTEPKTPECDKLSAVKDQRNAIVQFLEWLSDQGIELAAYHKHTDACCDEEGDRVCGLGENTLWGVNKRHESMAYEFLGIDEKKLEAERQMILEHIRQ